MATLIRASATIGIACAGVCALATPAAADDVLDPATHVSPSGRFVLSVEPGAKDGSGPADYRLARDGETVWKRRLPVSLWDAAVTDNGRVAGYAYEGGVSTGRHGMEFRGLQLVVLAPDGEVLNAVSWREGRADWIFSGWGDCPPVTGLFVDQAADRVVFRVHRVRAPVVWWTYSLETGAWTGDVVPECSVLPRDRDELDAIPVPGTPLTLVHWHFRGFGRLDAGLGLVGRDGAEVWMLRIQNEYTGLGEDWEERVAAGPEQVALEPGGFSFVSYASSSRRTFVVTRDESERWRVVETDPVPLDLTNPRAATTDEVRPCELELLGEIELQLPLVEDPSTGAMSEVRVLAAFVHSSCIYALSDLTNDLFQLDLSGARIRTFRPSPGDLEPKSGLGRIAIDGEDSVWFHTGRRPLVPRGYLGFRANGERIALEHLGVDAITEDWIFLPGSRKRWVLGYGLLHVVGEDGRLERTIHKRPDGKWMQRVREGAVSPDGSLAVVVGPQGWIPPSGRTFLCVYSPHGDPVRSIPLGDRSASSRVAFDGSTAVIADTNDGALYLYDLDGDDERPAKFDPPGPAKWWTPFFSPDGEELWLHESGSPVLLRYRLP
jgi:hypothetical protein